MRLASLASAVPPARFTQHDVWEILRKCKSVRALRTSSRGLLEKILCGPSGIDTRHFATADPEALFAMDAGSLSRHYEKEAPRLAVQALAAALQRAGLRAADLDALFLCSCTGYLCPGPSSHVAEQLGMRADAVLHDVVGLGCGAAIPTLRAAAAHIAANPSHVVATVAVEICSAAFFVADDPGVLISLCLFGDAASAAVWSADARGPRIGNFVSVHRPEHREAIRFVNDGGYLRNRLDRSVPAIAAAAVGKLVGDHPGHDGPPKLITHPGGRDVLDAIAATLPDHCMQSSREAMRRFGNCSSPSVLLALEIDMEHETPHRGPRSLTAFGAGFSCHAAVLG
ncbi:MAG: stilbene synthase [Chthoniobacterales bacterium]|nr:stilbene synthase [Chthoniobacterales bacterium]